MSPEDAQFVAWIMETLVPDLEESGRVETAADIRRLVGIINYLDEFVERSE